MKKTCLKRCSYMGAIATGVITSMLSTMVLVIILVVCINCEYIEIANFRFLSHAVNVVGLLPGCIVSSKLYPAKRSIAVFTTAGVYFALLVLLACLLFDGVGGSILLNACLSVVAVIPIILLGDRNNKARTLDFRRRRTG